MGERGRQGGKKDRDMESKGLGKIQYRAQTSCSIIERLGQEQPLTGTADLKLFLVKSRNKCSGEKNEECRVILDVIDSGYHIAHPIRLYLTCFPCVLKTLGISDLGLGKTLTFNEGKWRSFPSVG